MLSKHARKYCRIYVYVNTHNFWHRTRGLDTKILIILGLYKARDDAIRGNEDLGQTFDNTLQLTLVALLRRSSHAHAVGRALRNAHNA